MESLNFDNYLFRCSSLGKLMTGVKPALTPKQDVELARLLVKQKTNKITENQIILLGDLLSKKNAENDLSVTTKNYLKEIHKEVIFKRQTDLKNKFLEKGIQVEEQSLTLYSKVSNQIIFKNKDRFYNDFIEGEPDNNNKIIRDVKSPWDYTTFPFYDNEIKNKDYICQLNGYMELTGLTNAELIYCLIDTPEKIINDELRRCDWKFNIMDNEGNVRDNSIDLVVEIVSNLIYTRQYLEKYCNENPSINIDWFKNFREIPENLRVKIFKIEKDDNLIKTIYEQIKKCRIYLNDLSIEIANQI